MNILDELLVARSSRLMPWRRICVYLSLLATCTGWWYRSDLTAAVPLPNDGHAVASLTVAVNRAFCGAPSMASTDVPVARLVMDDPRLVTVPLSTIVTDRWKTFANYCSFVKVPYVNNENALMLIESWILHVAPNISLANIGRTLLVCKVLLLGLFCAALLRGGMSVLMCVGVVQVEAAILHQLQPVFAYSVYSCFVPLILLPMAIYSLSATAARRTGVRLAVALLCGFVSAYCVNMRTSYLPLYLLMFLFSLLAGEWLPAVTRPLRARVLVSAAAVALFAAGYGAFQYYFIVRSRPVGGTGPSYHVVWHPTVLALGVPPNPLAEREGITWNDATGFALARRMNPSVVLMGPEYEAALSKYYFRLWRKYPGEMRQIYFEKFKLAGRSMIEGALFPSRWMAAILAVLMYVPNGFWLFVGLAAGSAASLWWHVRSGGAALLALAQLFGVGALLVVEAAMIMPYYYLTYHSTLLFASSMMTLCLGQLILNLMAVPIHRLLARRTHAMMADGV